MMILIIGILIFLGVLRYALSRQRESIKMDGTKANIGAATFIGDMEVQADVYHIEKNEAGLLTVLADGFGRGNVGKVASHVAVEACTTIYKQYKKLVNPQYYFKRSFNLANAEVLKYIEDRIGGTSLLTAFIGENQLFYALAGDIQISVFRTGELIPLSEGHTLNKLADKAYKEGKLTKQKALWTLKERRLWNYIGQDAFKEMELYDVPVTLKTGDQVVLMTKGVYENVAIYDLEHILANEGYNAQRKADEIISCVQNSGKKNKENASVIIIEINKTRKERR